MHKKIIKAKEKIVSIDDVVSEDLCIGCGTCVGICPMSAAKMIKDNLGQTYIPLINYDKCNNCGLCLDVCPGYEVNFKDLNVRIFHKEPDDILIGNFQNCYVGYATDSSIRYNAASGGMVSALLIYALEKKIIDGALVTKMSEKNPLEPLSFIARTKEEIISASKSKYCPVSSNTVLRDILNEGEKIAVVGLPCHIHAIRKAELINKDLAKRIVLHLGLFCSHADTFWQTEFLLKRLNLRIKDIARIDYRGEGWSGKMKILLKDGKKVILPYSESISYHSSWIHAILRCTMCCDFTNELADISFGDAWLHEILKKDKDGSSIIITRTKGSEELCDKAKADGAINLVKIDPFLVKKSANMMQTKKKNIKARFFIRKLFGNPIPLYDTYLLHPKFFDCIKGTIVYINAWLSSKRYLRKIINPLVYAETAFLSSLHMTKGILHKWIYVMQVLISKSIAKIKDKQTRTDE